ncbi:PAS domain S-box protein [Salinimonas sp. HHU 13199]|uniref:PAS domain S-box protein n=1 Tax=Salinimonas profundi TaxID=2729140 RepID=A0ABR8LNB1_9ALTE|nr:methyl-accepting chemotaxis protein [Salinimonas profundi]MBD3585574.1 PAS domain S-box protein [Salinimonas profundi]
MFNNRLKSEISRMQEELHHLRQTRNRLDDEMLYCRLSQSGNLEYVNSVFCEELGYRQNDVLDKDIFSFIPEVAKHTPHYEKFKTAFRQQSHYVGVVNFTKADGTEGWLRTIMQPVKNFSGELLHFTLHSSDLTRTISQSKEHENLVDALQRSTAVIEFEPDGTIITANTPFLRATGYRLEEIRGKHHKIFCESSLADSDEYRQFWQYLNQGQFHSGRFKRIDSSGNVLWLEASYNPVLDPYGRLYKVVKFASVVTEQVEREQAISGAAEIAFSTSQQTDNSATQGSDVIRELVSVMNSLAERMVEASEGITELDEQSQQIATIINSISGIAEQTNLLALNAAIEAARAGDQGRGFAVVADEVRQLASRTTAATEEIVSVVQRNQSLTSDAVARVNAGKEQAERGAALADDAGKVIVEIQRGAKEVVDAVGQFSQSLN